MNSSSLDQERERVRKLGKNPLYAIGINETITQLATKLIEPYLRGRVLELGPAEGVMTKELTKLSVSLEVVEGSKELSDALRKKYPNLLIHNELFEEFQTVSKYSVIIMSHVLEHVQNPIIILKRYREMLETGGRIVITVPNANSLHRIAAVRMGILSEVKELNERDLSVGHRRVYTRDELCDDVKKANLEIENLGGYWLKPISNQQIESSWTPEMVGAFFQLGIEYPEIASEILMVCK